MSTAMDRKAFLTLLGLGGVAVASRLSGFAAPLGALTPRCRPGRTSTSSS
jgi:hypothetical protein